MFTATGLAGSKHGSCNLDDDTYPPNGEPNDLLPLISMQNFTCDVLNVTRNSLGRVYFKLSRVKRPDVRSGGSCQSNTGTTCGTISQSGDCYCDSGCRGYGDCCGDKISVCGANWP